MTENELNFPTELAEHFNQPQGPPPAVIAANVIQKCDLVTAFTPFMLPHAFTFVALQVLKPTSALSPYNNILYKGH